MAIGPDEPQDQELSIRTVDWLAVSLNQAAGGSSLSTVLSCCTVMLTLSLVTVRLIAQVPARR